MITTKDIKSYIYKGFKKSEKFYVCDRCHTMGLVQDVFTGKYKRSTQTKEIEFAYCPECGELFQLIANHYTQKDITKIINKSVNIDKLIKLKREYSCFKDSNFSFYTASDFVYVSKINYYNVAHFSVNKLQDLFNDIVEIRKYYKAIIRKKFICFMAAYNDEYYIKGTANTRYNYYKKLQDQIIKTLLEDTEKLKSLWFVNYTCLLPEMKKLNDKDLSNLTTDLIKVMKTIEEFEFVNSDVAFNLNYEQEKILKDEGRIITYKYTIPEMESWVKTNENKIVAFTKIHSASDCKEDEIELNAGDKEYQLTEKDKAEYDNKIAEAEITKDYGLESLLA